MPGFLKEKKKKKKKQNNHKNDEEKTIVAGKERRYSIIHRRRNKVYIWYKGTIDLKRRPQHSGNGKDALRLRTIENEGMRGMDRI